MAHRARALLVAGLRPATELIGRLRYATKLVVIGLVLLIPLGVTVDAYVNVQRDQIDFSNRERDGLRYLTALAWLVGDVVQARHEEVTSPAVRPESDALDSSIAQVDLLDRSLDGSLRVHQDWLAARTLINTAQHLTDAPTSAKVSAYQDAADALLALILRLGDRSNLVLDPTLSSYYLARALQTWLPLLCDLSGRIADQIELASATPGRDEITTLLAVTNEIGIVVSTNNQLTYALRVIMDSFGNSRVPPDLAEQASQFGTLVAALVAHVSAATTRRSLAEFPLLAADAVRLAAPGFAAAIAAELDQLLATKIRQRSRSTLQITAWAALGTLLVMYLFGGFYLSVAGPIRSIVDTLQRVAQGDLRQRVTVSTRDELKYVATVLNQTIEKTEAATRRLARQATRDTLTTLPNRATVVDLLERAIALSSRTTRQMALIFIDLDRFKLINDSLGHEAGDEVLRTVADRLLKGTRTTDTVARLAGDEFIVVSEDLRYPDDAVRTAKRLLEAIGAPMVLTSVGRNQKITIGASVGIAFNTDGSSTPSHLLRNADVAMYQAKQRGRGRVEIFDDRLRANLEHQVRIQQDLRDAIDLGQLRVHYQPIVETTSGGLLGFEALVRWEHPTRGLLLPDEFIEIAEESGLIVPLGQLVLTEACQQAAQWRATQPGCADLHISVNVSAAQFNHASFVSTVSMILDNSGLDPDALWLEITETSVLADVTGAAEILDQLRTLGIHLALDDFGTGYSSLTYLRQLPVQVLKIDRSFVSGLGHSREDAAIVEMIINLADTLDLLVVAEGVETTTQLAELRRMGCQACQGYHFGRPTSADLVWTTQENAFLTAES